MDGNESIGEYLNRMLYRFEVGMSAKDWDDLGVYEDEGMACAARFVEFCIGEEESRGESI